MPKQAGFFLCMWQELKKNHKSVQRNKIKDTQRGCQRLINLNSQSNNQYIIQADLASR